MLLRLTAEKKQFRYKERK